MKIRFLPHTEQSVSISKARRLVLYKKKVAVYCKGRTLPVNTVHCVDKIHTHLVSRLRISWSVLLTPLKCLHDIQGRIFFFPLLPFCTLPVWVFETASLWLLSETLFCYGTVCSKYFNLFKYSYICTACSAKLMQILPGMFLRSVMSKSRSADLIRLSNSYRSHSNSKAVWKLCILSVTPCSECTATGKNTILGYGCDFAYFMVFKQRVTD